MKNKRDPDFRGRRKFISECAKYGALMALTGNLPLLANCSTTSAESSKTKVESIPDNKSNPLNSHAVEVSQNIVTIAKKGEPYDLTVRAVEALGGIDKFVHEGETVMLLPNIAWDRNVDQAANTHPDVVRAIIDLCKKAKAKEIGVFCHTCHPAQSTYKKSGIAEASEKAGAKVWYVEPGRDFKEVEVNGTNIKTTKVYTKLLASDRFISIPIAKVHSLSGYTMCMKNLLGAVENRPVYHANIQQDLADLLVVLKPDLNVLDATRILVKRGPTGGSLADVQKPETVIAAANPVSGDAVGMGLFNQPPEKLRALSIAQKLGLGEYDLDLLDIKEA